MLSNRDPESGALTPYAILRAHRGGEFRLSQDDPASLVVLDGANSFDRAEIARLAEAADLAALRTLADRLGAQAHPAIISEGGRVLDGPLDGKPNPALTAPPPGLVPPEIDLELAGFGDGLPQRDWRDDIEFVPDLRDEIAEQRRRELENAGFSPIPPEFQGGWIVTIKAPEGGLNADNAARYTDGIRRIYAQLWDAEEARAPEDRIRADRRNRPARGRGFTPLDGAETSKRDGRGAAAVTQVGDRLFTAAVTSVWARNDLNHRRGRAMRDELDPRRISTNPAWHAEGQALMRAYELTDGPLPRDPTMFTDREVCDDCQILVPKLMDKIGIDWSDGMDGLRS